MQEEVHRDFSLLTACHDRQEYIHANTSVKTMETPILTNPLLTCYCEEHTVSYVHSHMFTRFKIQTHPLKIQMKAHTHMQYLHTHTPRALQHSEEPAGCSVFEEAGEQPSRKRGREMKEVREGVRDKGRYCCHFSFSPLSHRLIPSAGK